MKKIIPFIIIAVIAFAAGIAVESMIAQNALSDYDEETIEEKIADISELAALEYNYTDQATFKGEAKKLFGKNVPFTEKGMQIQYSGTVKMGPDLDKMKIDLDRDNEKVTITLPRSVILSHSIDEDSMQIIYVDNGIFNSVTPKDTNQLRREAKAEKEKKIRKSDLFDQADERAAEEITAILKTAWPQLQIETKVK